MESAKAPLLHSSDKCNVVNIPHDYIQVEETDALWIRWDNITSRTAQGATLPFLLMQFPQIILNTRNLISGNSSALFAVGWTAQLSSLMGNLSLLSYFVTKKESGASIVQAVGVATTVVVLLQLALAGAMPWPAFIATLAACTIGFVLSCLSFANVLSDYVWKIWIEIMGIGGIYVLVQVVWSTFESYLPHSLLPGITAAISLLVLILLDRSRKLPTILSYILGGVSGWVATLLFMWSPVSQLYTNVTHPENLYGLSVFTILLAFAGNSMLMPRALFIRDLMWFTGCSWGTVVWGWGILLSMYIFHATKGYYFWTVTAIFIIWLGFITTMDMKSYHLRNPLRPYVELILRSRKYEKPGNENAHVIS